LEGSIPLSSGIEPLVTEVGKNLVGCEAGVAKMYFVPPAFCPYQIAPIKGSNIVAKMYFVPPASCLSSVSTELLTLAFDVFASPEKKDKTVVKSSTNLKNEIKDYVK
jgi:hypothetical protein